jgi:hypothetical protein
LRREAYGRTALVATLNQGVTAPTEEPSDAVEAAQLIAEVLRAKADIDEGRGRQRADMGGGLSSMKERAPVKRC